MEKENDFSLEMNEVNVDDVEGLCAECWCQATPRLGPMLAPRPRRA